MCRYIVYSLYLDLISRFRFNIKGHQYYICNGPFVKSAFSYVFNNSEAMVIKGNIFFLTKQRAKMRSTLILC